MDSIQVNQIKIFEDEVTHEAFELYSNMPHSILIYEQSIRFVMFHTIDKKDLQRIQYG